MKLSLSQRLTNYLKARPGTFISGGELERIATAHTTYKPSTVSRRLRELAEDGVLTRQEEKRTVWYAYQPQERVVTDIEVRDGIAYRVEKTVVQ